MIVDAIRSGVQIFDLRKLTYLRPDWSKQGLGYFLMHKTSIAIADYQTVAPLVGRWHKWKSRSCCIEKKRLLRSNFTKSSSIESDIFSSAMLQLRNLTATVKYLQLGNGIAFLNKLDNFSNPVVWPVWREAWKFKKEALCTRFIKNAEAINHKARKLQPLYVGNWCLLQNQSGKHQRKWDRSGVVIKCFDMINLWWKLIAHQDWRKGIEGFWGCTTQSQQVLMQGHSMVGSRST